MANAHSTRRNTSSFSRPQNHGATAQSLAPRHKTSSYPRRTTRPSSHALRTSNAALIPQLQAIARLLRGVYSSCITAELALQAQNADRDPDIRWALRTNVSDPVSRQVDRLNALLVDLARSRSS